MFCVCIIWLYMLLRVFPGLKLPNICSHSIPRMESWMPSSGTWGLVKSWMLGTSTNQVLHGTAVICRFRMEKQNHPYSWRMYCTFMTCMESWKVLLLITCLLFAKRDLANLPKTTTFYVSFVLQNVCWCLMCRRWSNAHQCSCCTGSTGLDALYTHVQTEM